MSNNSSTSFSPVSKVTLAINLWVLLFFLLIAILLYICLLVVVEDVPQEEMTREVDEQPQEALVVAWRFDGPLQVGT